MLNISEYKDKVNYFFEIMIENEEIADIKISEEKWTLKEMVAHLIETASDHHHVVVKLQINKKIVIHSYDPEIWKGITKINGYNTMDLINLWKEYNNFLLYLTNNIDENYLSNTGEYNGTEYTLKYMIEDYYGQHMDWHIELYKKRIDEIKRNQHISL